VNPVPRWRIAAAVAVLGALLGFAIVFTPIYLDNLQLQSFVGDLTRLPGSLGQADDELREAVAVKANQLKLPVKADNVHILRTPGSLRITVRYFVRVNLPGYTVDLHFNPTAANR
jgi:hypothetical protein